MSKGNGDFSIGNRVWPGTSKLIEEMGELQQVLGKLIAIHGNAADHWSGDLRKRLVEECADVAAALEFFIVENLSREELLEILDRRQKKTELFRQWHSEQQ